MCNKMLNSGRKIKALTPSTKINVNIREVVEVALPPKEIMGDGLKILNFQESKGLYVLF